MCLLLNYKLYTCAVIVFLYLKIQFTLRDGFTVNHSGGKTLFHILLEFCVFLAWFLSDLSTSSLFLLCDGAQVKLTQGGKRVPSLGLVFTSACVY